MIRPFATISLAALSLALATEARAQTQPDDLNDIVVTAQRENATQIVNGGSAGVLGDKPAEDLPFAIRSYDETLILNQQPQTLGDVLENDPTIRLSYGFGNAAELFVIRGFALFGDDIGLNGLYGVTPRQLVAPELLGSVRKPVPVKRGGIYIQHGWLQHGSLPNMSGQIRWSFDLRYQPIGQPTGRPEFPGFVLRSQEHPELVLNDYRKWRTLWEDARSELATDGGPLLTRWDSDTPSGC